ncbi:MAG: cation transporter [Clostridia bacterium]|nr:cation transporter [Clostridia bacterium]
MKSCRYILKDLDCAACGKKIEDRIAKEDGFEDVNVNFSTLNLSFKTDKSNPKQEIIKIIKEVEPEVKVLDINEKNKDNEQRDFLDIFRLVLGIGIYLMGLKLKLQGTMQIISTVICILVLLSKTLKKATSEIKRKVLDENILITVSVIGACLVGKTFEGIMVITLYEIGKILESKAINKTRKSISNLMDIKPEYANLKVNRTNKTS